MTILFSLTGLLISVITLYLTQFNKPRIRVVTDNTIQITYNYYDDQEYFELLLPISFINNSPNSGTALKCAICLISKGGESYFMTWETFYKVDFETGRFAAEELALPFVIGGHSSSRKIIMFNWLQSGNNIRLTDNEYELKLYAWFSSNINTKPDKMVTMKFTVNDDQIGDLNRSLSEAKIGGWNPYISFPLNTELPKNQKLTEAERIRFYDL